jgi:hypothetical protein
VTLRVSEISRALARGDIDDALLLLTRDLGEVELASVVLDALRETEARPRARVTRMQVRAQLARDIQALRGVAE